LLQTVDYALHVNAKKIEASATHPDRTARFDCITRQRQIFAAAGQPIISVDTQQTELIGNFKNAGCTWWQEAEAVNVHDLLKQGLGRAVPYGLYDVTHHQGTGYVGSSGDTAQCAVAALVRWWQPTGQRRCREADHLLILAAGGGSTGWRNRRWQHQRQERWCDARGLTVTGCPSPTGCSKGNPMEHRLFGPISLNWVGYPLRTWETMLAYFGGTTTTTGLAVHAERLDGHYATSLRVPDAVMATLKHTAHDVCPPGTTPFVLAPTPSVPQP
jgi:hypothetical protein